MESADMQLVMFALIATIPLVGAMMAITPLLQPNGQAFSVSVPEVAQNDPGIRVLKHRFVAIIAALTAILTLAAVAFCLMGNMKAVMALVVAAVLLAYDEWLRLACRSLGVTEHLQPLSGMDRDIERVRVEGELEANGMTFGP